MGFSNYLPSSRISQAGVIPNAAARPASPFEGQVIYETDTDRVLVWNASAWVAPNSTTANPPGLELVKTTTFTSVSTLPMDNVFSSSYSNYRVLATLPVAGANGYLRFVLLNNGSDVNGTNYYTAGYSVAYNAGLSAVQQSGATFYSAIPGNLYNGASLSMDIFYSNNGEITSYNSHCHTRGNAVSYSSAGGYHAAAAQTGFRFYSDVTVSGTVSVYGYRN